MAVAALLFGLVIPAIRPFEPKLNFENIRVKSRGNGDGTTSIKITGTLRNVGREWLRFPARHTQISGCYTTDEHPTTPLRFDTTDVVDTANAGLGPAQSMDLDHTFLIPHSRLVDVSVTLSIQASAGDLQSAETRYGWAESRAYKLEAPSNALEPGVYK